MMDALLVLLNRRTKLVITTLFVTAMGMTLWPLYRLSERVVESTSIEDAAHYSEILLQFRKTYASETINRLPPGVEVTHDYEGKPGAVPLPITMSLLVGKALSDNGKGGSTHIYSPYPFKTRADGGLPDQFARDAWAFLKDHPQEPFYRVDGPTNNRVLRYATADIMREACVRCHNAHPASPKVDWKVGDVRGIVEVVLPLERALSRTDADVRNALVLTTFMMVFVFLLLSQLIAKLRATSQQLQSANERLQDLSTTDELTQLANVRYFRNALQKEHQRAARFETPYSVLFLDVDHFKQFNDQHGHIEGDRVLRSVAALLKQTSREIDVPARYGGEEFVVLCPGVDEGGAEALAERLRTAIEALDVGPGAGVSRSVTVSIGIASYPGAYQTAEEVLASADRALYSSKNAGRNRVTRSFRPAAVT